MRAARLHRFTDDMHGALEIEEVDAPDVHGATDVLVEVEGAGWCQTDNHVVQGMWHEDDAGLPQILGHENAGVVAAVGDEVTSVSEGDSVVVLPAATCGTCRACRRGLDFHCEELDMPGITSDGGFAEYMVVPERSVLPTEADPLDVAPMGDAGATSYRSVKKAVTHLAPGDHAAVFGIGGLGHVGLQILRTLSPVDIIAVDVREDALALADELGADHTIDASTEDVPGAIEDLTDGRGVAQAIDFAGTDESLKDGIESLAVGGDHHVVGYGGDVHVPAQHLIATETSFVGNLCGQYHELQELMTLVEDGAVALRTTIYDLEEINDVAERLDAGEIDGRAVITP